MNNMSEEELKYIFKLLYQLQDIQMLLKINVKVLKRKQSMNVINLRGSKTLIFVSVLMIISIV